MLVLGLGGIAQAKEANPILDVSFIGWSVDGKKLAYEKSVGHFDAHELAKNWKIVYVGVKTIANGKVEETFQIYATTNAARFDPKEWQTYVKAKGPEEWEAHRKSQGFIKLLASSSSPSRRWKIAAKISDKAIVRTHSIPAKTLDDELMLGRELRGQAVSYRVEGVQWFQEEGKWDLEFIVTDGKRDVRLYNHRLASGKNRASGYPEGLLLAYWAPDERAVAVEWIYSPMAGGGNWMELFVGRLPD